MTTVANRTSSLNAAKAAKNDEFYTQWADIEREVNAYLEFDPDVFRDKIVLLPCDDPEWSNFAKFFALHFVDLGLKKLISTSYAPDSNPATFSYEPTLFELDDPKFDATKTHTNGKKFILEMKDVNDDGVINIDDLQWEYLDGDGDFRSAEVTALRDEADIVITNPPFSLFRAFIGWLVEGGKTFSVIGNSNATTYVEIFPLIQQNRLWKGATANSTDMVFGVPKGAPVKEADRLKAERLGYPSTDKHDFTRLGNACWFTNIDHGRRHEPLQLMTIATTSSTPSTRTSAALGTSATTTSPRPSRSRGSTPSPATSTGSWECRSRSWTSTTPTSSRSSRTATTWTRCAGSAFKPWEANSWRPTTRRAAPAATVPGTDVSDSLSPPITRRTSAS